jgi:hypothetical protein
MISNKSNQRDAGHRAIEFNFVVLAIHLLIWVVLHGSFSCLSGGGGAIPLLLGHLIVLLINFDELAVAVINQLDNRFFAIFGCCAMV